MQQLFLQFAGGESLGLSIFFRWCLSLWRKLCMRVLVLFAREYDFRWDFKEVGSGSWSIPYIVVWDTMARQHNSCKLSTEKRRGLKSKTLLVNFQSLWWVRVQWSSVYKELVNLTEDTLPNGKELVLFQRLDWKTVEILTIKFWFWLENYIYLFNHPFNILLWNNCVLTDLKSCS